MEAVKVLQRCEHRRAAEGLGPISKDDLAQGNLKEYLKPEDYKPLQDVSCFLVYCDLGVRRADAECIHVLSGRTPGVRRNDSCSLPDVLILSLFCSWNQSETLTFMPLQMH